MGCFLGCFGSTKDLKKRPKTPHFASIHNPKQYYPIEVCPTVTTTVIANQDEVNKPTNLLVSHTRPNQAEEQELSLSSKDKFDEPIQLSSGTRKKVTFDTNVKEYEHVSLDDPQEIEKGGEKEVVVECGIKPIKSSSESEGSTLSSLGLFPPNHRYQNCNGSDDEDGLEFEVSDLDEEEEEEDEGYDDEYSDDEYNPREVHEVSARPCSSVESRTKSSPTCFDDDGYNDHVMHEGSLDKEKTPVLFNRGARDRAGYVHSVMNPIENTAQWKTVKVRGTLPMKEEQKENFLGDLGFQQSSTKPKSKLDEDPKNDHEVAIDASLSTWLASSLKTPPSKGIPINWVPKISGSSESSKGSNSVRSQEERTILGVLTVHEIKQFSATSSLRRSPCRSPEEIPVVGIVGVHWSDTTPVQETGSVSSFKGIPNTTSKYREDQRVNWHSTPFETRLEKALNRCAAECDDTHRAC